MADKQQTAPPHPRNAGPNGPFTPARVLPLGRWTEPGAARVAASRPARSTSTLEAEPPRYGGGVPDIAVLTAVVAVDYLRLRFKDAPWVEPIPRLQALRDAVAERPAFAATEPYV